MGLSEARIFIQMSEIFYNKLRDVPDFGMLIRQWI